MADFENFTRFHRAHPPESWPTNCKGQPSPHCRSMLQIIRGQLLNRLDPLIETVLPAAQIASRIFRGELFAFAVDALQIENVVLLARRRAPGQANAVTARRLASVPQLALEQTVHWIFRGTIQGRMIWIRGLQSHGPGRCCRRQVSSCVMMISLKFPGASSPATKSATSLSMALSREKPEASSGGA